MMDYRKNKDLYYLNIADAVSKRSTCLRKRYGAILYKTMRSSPPAITVLPEGV